MAFIVSAIASLTSILVFLNSKHIVENRIAQLVIRAIAGLIGVLTTLSAVSHSVS